MKSWKTTLGGALGAFGKTLVGIGVVPQLSGTPSLLLTYITVAGFILEAVGDFIGHLFSADTQQVQKMQKQIDAVPSAISSGDTEFLKKEISEQHVGVSELKK